MRSVPVGIVLMMVMALLPGAFAARADIINVPGDYPTIQAGIDAAVDGDKVIIADGVYTGDGNHTIDFLGKAITVRSANGPDTCIINLQGLCDTVAFRFTSGETRAAVLNGVTVTGADLIGVPPDSAVTILDSSPMLIDCVFRNNLLGGCTLSFGGAIYSNGNPIIVDCVFEENAVAEEFSFGGAFHNDGGDPLLIGCSFIDNQAAGGCGGIGWGSGGALASSGGQLLVVDCHFQDNTATGYDGWGGAIHLSEAAATIIGCTFSANDAFTTGGAINLEESVATIIDCTFTANKATLSNGGGVSVSQSAATVVGCTFLGNCGELGGGGLYTDAESGTLMINCAFIGNEAKFGGGLLSDGMGTTLLNCTLVDNNSNSGGGGAFLFQGLVSNCIASGNFPDGVAGTATVTYSNIQGGWPGEGNIDADPLFVDPENGDYRLAAGSPCIDAGDNGALYPCLFRDLAGNEPLFDDPKTRDTGLGRAPIVDMGPYEFGSPPADDANDCNGNWFEDDCELAIGFTPDCNRNGVPDNCDIAEGFSQDVNGNHMPDECEDCNDNGVPDDLDIADGASADCNGNAIPDECDIADGFSNDCNRNGTPDECEPDCNGDGIPDACDDWTVSFTYPVDLPEMAPVNEKLAIEVVIETTGEVEIDPASATIHVSIDGGAFESTPMAEIGELTYLAMLPASACGTLLEYYFSVETVGGCAFIDPSAAPEDRYAAYAGTAVTEFLEAFEGDVSGWTVESDRSLTTGEWEQAEPNGTLYQGDQAAPSRDATPGEDDVMAFVTENGPRGGDAGDTDVDGGPTHLISPSFDLADTFATISYARWFYTRSGVHDEMTIEISADDGETWVLVDAVTSTDSQWQTASFVVNDFIEPTSVVRVRFKADDTPNDSVTEAGIDDFALFIVSCGENCPWDLDGDGAVGTGDLIVMLGSWGDPYGTADLIELLGAWGPCP